ncbi:MAG: hypothetical protein U0694_16705 [Anaerolineae bacterium]
MKQNDIVQPSAFGRLNFTLLTSGALWVVSVFLAGMAVFALREVLIWGVALVLAGPDRLSQLRAENMVTLANNCGVAIFGVLALAAIISISEYFFHHADKPRTLRMLLYLVAVECAIVLPVWAIFWR